MTAVTLSTGAKGKAITEALAPFVDPIHEDLLVLGRIEQDAASCKVRLGGSIAEAVTAMTAAGASAEEAQERILRTVGPEYKWATLQAWTRAYVVEQTLGETERGTFGVDALQAIGRVPEKDGERAKFAASLREKGTTGTYKVRDAVTAHKGSSSAPKGNSERAADIVKRGKGEKGDGFRSLVSQITGGDAALVSLVLAGYSVLTGKDAEKYHRDAMEELVSFVREQSAATPAEKVPAAS